MKEPGQRQEDFTRYRKRLLAGSVAPDAVAETLRDYNRLFRDALREAAENAALPYTLCASGSLARGELTPYSAAELLVFPAKPPLSAEERAELKKVWTVISKNMGVAVSVHFVCPEPGKTLTVETVFRALASSPKTILHGSEEDYFRCMTSLHRELQGTRRDEFIETIISGRAQRIAAHGASPYLLEPHLLNSAGGLLDVRVCELLCGVITGEAIPMDFDTPYEELLFAYLSGYGFISPDEAERLRDAYRLLLHTRFQLHLLKKMRTDRYEYSAQRALAKLCAGANKQQYRAFMKGFYSAVMVTSRTFNAILKKFRTFQSSSLPEQLAEALDESFVLKAGRISSAAEIPLTMGAVTKAFYYRARYHAWFSDRLRNDILHFVPDPSAQQDIFESFVYFKKILQMEEGVGEALAAMHELQFLGKVIPSFEETRGLTQNHTYHYYTVDEHTLKAIASVEALDPFSALPGKVFKTLRNKELLYLALLFHDIAKPIAAEGHELIGAEYAVSFMETHGYDEHEITMVDFLVRYHEMMYKAIMPSRPWRSNAAQTFAPLFPAQEYLDYMYVCTVGDLSAADPRVLNSWKSGLLEALYLETRRLLAQKQGDPEERETMKELAENLPPLAEAAQPMTLFPDAEQGAVERVPELDPSTLFFISFEEHRAESAVRVYLRKKHMLAKAAGVLSINGVLVKSAALSTREDGLMVFGVNCTDERTGEKLLEAVRAKISNDLSLVANGLMQVEFEIKKFRAQWNTLRRSLFTKKHHQKLHFSSEGKSTTLRLRAPSAPGMLYHLLQKFYDLGLIVNFMKADLKEGGYDCFFSLTDLHKKKISTHYYHFIETELHRILAQG